MQNEMAYHLDDIFLDEHGPFIGVLERFQEFEIVGYDAGREPDPDWYYSDRMGHEHKYSKDRKYPTLKAKYKPCNGMCGDPEHKELAYYRCKKCREKIVPGTRFRPGGEMVIPGGESWQVRIEISEEEPYLQTGEYIFRTISPWFKLEGRAVVSSMTTSFTGGSVLLSGIGPLEYVNEAG